MAHKSRVLEQSDQSTFFNVIPSPPDERDWNAEPLYDKVSNVPSKLDWRSHLQRVRNQGVQGACLAFVGACMVEWYSRKILKEPIFASAQYLYNLRPRKNQTLMTGRELMKTLKEYGCCKEESYDYGCKDPIGDALIQEGSQFKIDGYARIRTMETLKKALIVNGPCLISFPVYNHTTNLWLQRKEEEKLGCHAMAVVGYNSKGFIIRNSWGEHWDDNGYCLYPYEDWGCHDEIWTVVNEDNIKKWDMRRRSMIVKRVSGAINTVVDENRRNSLKKSGSESIISVKAESKTAESPPSPRKRTPSIKKDIVEAEPSLQEMAHNDEFDTFNQKDKFAGTNEMKRSSFVSSMFGGSSRKKAPVQEEVEDVEEVVEEHDEEDV